MKSDLLALQSSLQRHLLDGDRDIESSIASQHGIAPGRRLLVYRQAYQARIVDALRDSFGHLASYVGDEWFEADAMAYVGSHPSTQSSLNDYGAGFAAWLHLRHPHDDEIGELAALDWALRRAFDGADATPLDLQTLAAVAPQAWSRIGFTLVPTATRMRFRYNTMALWQALDDETTPPCAEPLQAPGDVLIWRRGHSPHFRSIGALESQALDGVQGGRSFAAICERLAIDFPDSDVAVEAGTLLRRWVAEELLCALVDPMAAP